MQVPIKKKWLITFIVILILALLNPTKSDFQDYEGINKNETNTGSISKKMNFLIGSVYCFQGKYYLGMLKNFILIKDGGADAGGDYYGK